MASTEHTRQRPIPRFRARQHAEQHGFVNLDEALLHEAHQALVWGVGEVSGDLCQMFDPGDICSALSQSCLQAHLQLESSTVNLSTMNSEKGLRLGQYTRTKSERAEM